MASIVAIVSTSHESVAGGAPIFIEKDAEKAQETAFFLEKIMDATAHDLKNGSFILVDRSR